MSKAARKSTRRTNSSSPIRASMPTVSSSLPTEIAATTPLLSHWIWHAVRFQIGVLLLIGILARFVGLDWDSNFHLHPDERFLTLLVPKLAAPQSWTQWFHTDIAPLNPFNLPDTGLFVYGQWPLMLTKVVAVWTNRDSYDGVLVVGRWLSAFFDAGTVAICWFIARRLIGSSGALLAATLLAFTALHIQHAHFFVVDTFATFWICLSFWFALLWHDRAVGSLKSATIFAAVSGVAWGLALACKISTGLFLPVLLAFTWAIWRDTQKILPSRTATKSAFGGAFLLMISALLLFRVFHPIAFRGEPSPFNLGGLLDLRFSPRFWASVAEQRAISAGQSDLPWNLQWIGQRDFVEPLRNLIGWGIGPFAALTAIFGTLTILGFAIQKRRQANKISAISIPFGLLVAAAWTLFVFVYHAVQYSKFTRYFLLMTPFAAIIAAWCGREIWRLATRHSIPRTRALAIGLNGVLLGGTTLWGASVASIYTRPMTRVAATDWMLGALPSGTVIANESAWDDKLPLGDTSRFEMLDLQLYDADDPTKRAHLLATLERADWIVISSPRLWGSIPRLSNRWPLSSEYYRALFDGRLGFQMARRWTSYPRINLFGWQREFPDDSFEEALSVYDHPHVMLFSKTPQFSRANAESILDATLLDRRDDTPLRELLEQKYRVDESKLPRLP